MARASIRMRRRLFTAQSFTQRSRMNRDQKNPLNQILQFSQFR